MEIEGAAKMEVSGTLIDKIYGDFCKDIHCAKPLPSSRTNEFDLVRGVLHILQGSSSSLFYWDDTGLRFRANAGVYVNHLSHTSLHALLNQFMYAATCLKLVEIVVSKVESSLKLTPPTLRAFACAVSAWLKRLRGIALKEEEKIHSSDIGSTPTLLGMASSLSSLCSGAEYLLQVVNGAVPQVFLEPDSPVPAAEMAVHVLDHLYKKLNEVCPVQGGEEEAYLMLLYIFVGSSLPYIEVLDSWLYEGALDDPFEEMFFYSNKDISIDEAEFWERSYLLRPIQYQKFDTDLTAATGANDQLSLKTGKKETAGRESISKGKDWSNGDFAACPFFIRDIAKSIVSAGKSLQLIRHVPTMFPVPSARGEGCVNDGFGSTNHGRTLSEIHWGQSRTGLTLSEVFCVSLAGLIGHGDHISERFCWDDLRNPDMVFSFESHVSKHKLEKVDGESISDFTCLEKTWCKLLVDTLSQKRVNDSKSRYNEASDLSEIKEENMAVDVVDELPFLRSFCPENPAITLCQSSLSKMRDAWSTLNLSQNFLLPPLNDGALRQAIFGGESGSPFVNKGTNYAFGFHYDDSDLVRSVDDTKLLETLFPFPTLLPSFEENLHLSELLPFQNNSTMPSRVLRWIQSVEPKVTPLPGVIMQECLIVYIKKQVDFIGRHILSKLMNGWRLMDELGVLRAIYLLGSGDLLQHFLTVMFNKLDRGESWDDDFELNMILQESIGNSADSMLLSSPDSLVVSISKNQGTSDNVQPNAATLVSTPRRSREQRIGIDGLDSLEFTYKVSWPLELIANKEAIKKYNQVMHFLLKVKRAKFVLDKARRWMWKDKGAATISRKQHWLVEQKLLHFVDAFHQYVMDRVYHSAWRELCQGMEAAGSLDEVIEVHEAYLLSIQRQCFVVPDKLWALIASRINSILGLALDFYSIQQTLSSGGAVSAIKARCEMEVDRIEKQFDDCIAFLLRVLSFKLNVGHFPHLADLVTRINYSYFYMSDSGNLITAPGSDSVTSRLGKAFPVTTTRIEAVAELSDDRTYVHRLRFLRPDESWELFCKKAFPDQNIVKGDAYQCPPDIEKLGQEMVAICDGLPLALIVLGGLLSRKQLHEWPKVKDHIWRELRNDSIHISSLLTLSFNDLPHELKPCFLYLGLYPEDFFLNADKLMRLWVAEGFIQKREEDMDLEELAEDYLKELIGRSLIQVVKSWRAISTCRVHDLLRDLAINKARELNFLHFYDQSTNSAPSLMAPSYRRLAFRSGFQNYISLDHSYPHVRTLLFFNNIYSMEKLTLIHTRFRLLRVLDLNGVNFISERLPNTIGKLIHLRYLGLNNTGITALSESIGNLEALQTLEGSLLMEMTLPREICKLKKLRHLRGYFSAPPLFYEELTDLRSLMIVDIGDSLSQEEGEIALNPMAKLQNLEILSVMSRAHLLSIQPLLECQHLLELRIQGSIGNLPRKMHKFLPKLKYLELIDSELEQDPMPTLKKLPNLVVLHLIQFTGAEVYTFTAEGFSNLQLLELRTDSFARVQMGEGALPRLRALSLHDAKKCSLPKRLRSLPAIKDLNWEWERIPIW